MATTEELTQRRKNAIKRRMERTRARLAGRLHVLGDTIHGVTETVASVKETVDSTVESVQETVKSTVDTVQETVKSTVDTAKDVFDFKRHPFAWMGGSVAAGFLLGRLVHAGHKETHAPGFPAGYPYPGYAAAAATTTGSTGATAPAAGAAKPEDESSFVGNLFGGWFDRLKGMGVGAAVGLLRDLVVTEVPESLRSDVVEMGNNLIKDLGGEVLEPMLIDPSVLTGGHQEQSGKTDHGAHARPEEAQRPAGSTRPAQPVSAGVS